MNILEIARLFVEDIPTKAAEVASVEDFIELANTDTKKRGFNWKPGTAKPFDGPIVHMTDSMDTAKSIIKNGFKGKGALYIHSTKYFKDKTEEGPFFFGIAADSPRLGNLQSKGLWYGRFGVVAMPKKALVAYNKNDKENQVIADNRGVKMLGIVKFHQVDRDTALDDEKLAKHYTHDGRTGEDGPYSQTNRQWVKDNLDKMPPAGRFSPVLLWKLYETDGETMIAMGFWNDIRKQIKKLVKA